MLTNSLFQITRRVPIVHRYFKRMVRHLPARRRTLFHRGQRLIVDPNEMSGYYLYYERTYDVEIFDFLETQIAAYPKVLDIGANIGVYTVFFTARASRVDAFEPVPAVAADLRQNVAINGMNNVTVHELCIAGQHGVTEFSGPGQRNSGIGRIVSSGGDFVCPSITLDEFLNGRIDAGTLIKMDIEGAEWLAVQGAQASLRNRSAPFAILMEVHPEQIEEYNGSVERLCELLEATGLRVQAITQDGLVDFSVKEPPRFWWATVG